MNTTWRTRAKETSQERLTKIIQKCSLYILISSARLQSSLFEVFVILFFNFSLVCSSPLLLLIKHSASLLHQLIDILCSPSDSRQKTTAAYAQTSNLKKQQPFLLLVIQFESSSSFCRGNTLEAPHRKQEEALLFYLLRSQ